LTTEPADRLTAAAISLIVDPLAAMAMISRLFSGVMRRQCLLAIWTSLVELLKPSQLDEVLQ
jgi:hypothetical protein